MGLLDDLKAKIDQNGDGVNFDDFKRMAEERGVGGETVENMKDQVMGPDGKVDIERAKQVLGGSGDGDNSNPLEAAKDKLFGN